jgi:cytoskeletal protein CcmA (bactofilin family)
VSEKRQNDGQLSLLGAGTTFEGKIKTDGSIRIDGTLVGEVHAKASAAVGTGGVVEGSVNAKNVTVAGKVKGVITATDKLILEAKSVLHGDIRAARLVVDEGAMFDGKCNMTVPPDQQAGDPTRRPTS